MGDVQCTIYLTVAIFGMLERVVIIRYVNLILLRIALGKWPRGHGYFALKPRSYCVASLN